MLQMLQLKSDNIIYNVYIGIIAKGGYDLKKIIVIIMMLLITVSLPAMNSRSIAENEVLTQAPPWIRIGFVRGEITNIREEYYNGRLGYNCSASGVKITWYTYIFPLNFTIERVDVPETDWFFVWDNNFFGILRDGLIFGWIISMGLI